MMQQINTLRNEKERIREAKQKERDLKRKKQLAKEEVCNGARG